MLKSFVRVALRKILKNKGGSYVNILCLALGIATCLFIFNFLFFELSYDRFDGSDQVYRLERILVNEENEPYWDAATARDACSTLSSTQPLLACTFLSPYSEEGSAQFTSSSQEASMQRIYLDQVYYASPTIQHVLPIRMVIGSMEEAAKTNRLFLSHSAAAAIYGKEYQQNRSLLATKLQSTQSVAFEQFYIVAGVFEDLPANSHIHFDALAIASAESSLHPSYTNAYTYFVSDGEVPRTLETNGERFMLRPVDEIHLASNISNNPEAGTSVNLLIFLALIGVIVLLLSVGNYVNSLILNSFERAKEIGIRKLLGIQPRQLMGAFLIEALMVNFIAAGIALILFKVATNYSSAMGAGSNTFSAISAIDFERIIGAYLSENMAFLLAIAVINALLSSIYPAVYFNRLNPVKLLKNRILLSSGRSFSGASRMIKSLLVFQVASSILFLSGVYIVYAQWQHLQRNAQRPYQLSIMGVFPGSSGANERFTWDVYRRLGDLKDEGKLENYSFSNLFDGQYKTADRIRVSGIGTHELADTTTCALLAVNPNHWEVEGELLAGSGFNPRFGLDPRSALINTAAMKAWSYDDPDSLLNRILDTDFGELRILGIVDEPREPRVYVSGFEYRTYLRLTLQYPGNAGESVARFLHSMEVRLSTPLPYFSLLKRDYDEQQYVEASILRIFLFLSALAITIAAFGLFGLSKFIADKRAKEVGLRKILGASSLQAMWSLTLDFVKLIVVGAVLAIPFVLWGGQMWLNDYRVRIVISPSMVALPILLVAVLSLLVIAEKCWRAASINPIAIVRERN